MISAGDYGGDMGSYTRLVSATAAVNYASDVMKGVLSIVTSDKSGIVLYAIDGLVTRDGVLLGGCFESMISSLCHQYSILVLNLCAIKVRFEGVYSTGCRFVNRPLLRYN